MHPNCEVRRVSDGLGLGVFATRPIPRGTIVYVKDEMEIELSPAEYAALKPELRAAADRYSYIDPRGNRIISWDLAKYVNHSCEANSMSTGWGFELALRDIEAGEEITDEYGLFNMEEPMALACGCRECRGVLLPDDAERYHRVWDRRVRDALRFVHQVEQPLIGLLDDLTRADLERYLSGKGRYRSVRQLLLPEDEETVLSLAGRQRPAGQRA